MTFATATSAAIPLCLSALMAESAALQGADAVDYATQIQPIFESRCYECHGPSKQKALLRLDRKTDVFHDEPVDWVIIPGDAAGSPLWQRITLPPGDPDIMPKRGDPLTPLQIGLIRNWINQRSPWPDVPRSASAAAAKRESLILPALQGEAAQAAESAMKAIRARGWSAQRLAENTAAVEVRFSLKPSAFVEDDLRLLDGLERCLVWLDLARTNISDSALARLGRFTELRRIHLERTRITDAGLAHLIGLASLEYVDIYDTTVSDDGIEHLAQLPSLRKVYVWRTDISAAGIERLRAVRPDVTVVGGEPHPPSLGSRPAEIGQPLNCCLRAEALGMVCDHPCCVEAASEGKKCEKCDPGVSNGDP